MDNTQPLCLEIFKLLPHDIASLISITLYLMASDISLILKFSTCRQQTLRNLFKSLLMTS